MKTICIAILSVVMMMGSAGADEFSMPDEATLQQLIQHPEMIGGLIDAASEEQTAMLIIQVISLMQTDGMDPALIQAAVAVMFQKTAEVRGAQFGAAVVSMVRKKVNPRLLPIIRTGSAPPPPPGPSPRYPNQ